MYLCKQVRVNSISNSNVSAGNSFFKIKFPSAASSVYCVESSCKLFCFMENVSLIILKVSKLIVSLLDARIFIVFPESTRLGPKPVMRIRRAIQKQSFAEKTSSIKVKFKNGKQYV